MNIRIRNADLLAVTTDLKPVAGNRSHLPILQNLLIRARDGQITMTGTNFEVSVRVEVPGDILADGEITIPAVKLNDISRAIRNKDAEVGIRAIDEEKAEVSSDRSTFKVIGLRVDEFPEDVEAPADYRFNIEGEILLDAIHRTMYAASKEATRYFLNGLYFDFQVNHQRLAATDGRRLAIASVASSLLPPPTEDTAFGVIVPLPAMAAVQRLFKNSPEIRISLSEDDRHIFFSDDDTLLYSRLVEGEFPKYQQIIPSDNHLIVDLHRSDVLAAIKRTGLFANPKTQSITLQIEDGLMHLSTKTPELGEASESVEVMGEGDITIGFDSEYLFDAIRYIEAERVEVALKDSLSAAVIRPAVDHDFLGLIMPMRLEGDSRIKSQASESANDVSDAADAPTGAELAMKEAATIEELGGEMVEFPEQAFLAFTMFTFPDGSAYGYSDDASYAAASIEECVEAFRVHFDDEENPAAAPVTDGEEVDEAEAS